MRGMAIAAKQCWRSLSDRARHDATRAGFHPRVPRGA